MSDYLEKPKHIHLDFARESALEAAGTAYSLECLNNSLVPWYFYVYQTMPNQPREIFSTAWFASPIKVDSGAKITFRWTIDYTFVWGVTGNVQPGVTFEASQVKACDPASINQTTFSVLNNTPSISNPVTGGQAGSLTINMDKSVPNLTYATGIGMSGSGTFVQQALANAPQVYTPNPSYWIAAANQMQMGVVLAQTITGSAGVVFPTNVYKMYATLSNQNLWDVSQQAPVV